MRQQELTNIHAPFGVQTTVGRTELIYDHGALTVWLVGLQYCSIGDANQIFEALQASSGLFAVAYASLDEHNDVSDVVLIHKHRKIDVALFPRPSLHRRYRHPMRRRMRAPKLYSVAL